MKTLTQPRTLPGTMELLPQDQILMNEIQQVIKNGYESYGFLPLDTPIIESSEVLLTKSGGETEKQIYRFNKGDNDICLRFDLTVPLAKYVAANMNELTFPFRRYQIGKVYRGEKPQKGRFREFYQCDIDVIGKEKLSVRTDAEMPCIIYDIFSKLNIGKFTINISNRKLITGLIENLGLTNIKDEVTHLIDKYYKIGRETVKLTLIDDLKVDEKSALTIMDFVEIDGNNDEKLEKLKTFVKGNETYTLGVEELSEVVKLIRLGGVKEDYFKINLTIVRGLDYYTGTVYETTIDDYPSLGSVCGGGRYDNLSEYYTNTKLPGVGISIGITRLFYQLKEAGLIKSSTTSMTKLLIVPMDENQIDYCVGIANKFRANGINTEVYTQNSKFKDKLSYANKLNIPYCLIVGEDEIASGKLTLKDMVKREQIVDDLDVILKEIK